MRSLGGAIGIAACGTILNDRTNLHFLRIAEHLTSANAQFMNLLHEITARYTEAWGDSVSGQAAALKRIWLLAYREAQVQSFADAYLSIAVCFALSLMMVPLMRKLVSPGSLTAPSGSMAASHVALKAITPEEAENACRRAPLDWVRRRFYSPHHISDLQSHSSRYVRSTISIQFGCVPIA